MTVDQWLRRRFLATTLHDCAADAHHPHRGRFTGAYRRKKAIVKNVWILSGALVLL